VIEVGLLQLQRWAVVLLQGGQVHLEVGGHFPGIQVVKAAWVDGTPAAPQEGHVVEAGRRHPPQFTLGLRLKYQVAQMTHLRKRLHRLQPVLVHANRHTQQPFFGKFRLIN